MAGIGRRFEREMGRENTGSGQSRQSPPAQGSGQSRQPPPAQGSRRGRYASQKKGSRKREKNSYAAGALPFYGEYILTKPELAREVGTYLLLVSLISYLFYRNLYLVPVFLPGLWFFLKERKKALQRRREERICSQFLTGMQLVSTALSSGYAVENAFREALLELRKIYEEDSFAVAEFAHIVKQIRLNTPIETLLLSLGERSQIEDIRNFAEVFLAAKRTGGDLMAVIRNTVSSMRQKEETLGEIETVLAGKKMEQNIMSLIPILILVYVSLTSPESLEGMYHTPVGIAVMTGCLLLYLAAYFWGKKIMTFHV